MGDVNAPNFYLLEILDDLSSGLQVGVKREFQSDPLGVVMLSS